MDKPGRSGRSALLVATGILLSRASGLVRQVVFARFFGTSGLADAWTAALKLPNVLQNLLGEGSLSASFIPAYTELVHAGRTTDARRLAGAVLGLLAAVAGALVLLGALLAPIVVDVLAFGLEGERRSVTIEMVRLLFPMVGFLVLSAWALGILNSHRKFLLSYAAPVIWNVAIVGALLAGSLWWGLEGRSLLIVMGWGALAGGLLQFLVQLPAVWSLLGGVRPSLDRSAPGLGGAVKNFVPVVGARGFESVSGLVREVTLASLLMEGALSILGYVQTLHVLPISLFGLSVAAAELPELSREGADRGRVAARVRQGLARVQFWVVPTFVGYVIFGRHVVGLLYLGGSFGATDTFVTWMVLAAFALGLLATASSRMLSSAFYGLKDTVVPARAAVVRIVVSLTLGALFMIPLDRFQVGDRYLGAAGLGLGSATAAWLEYLLLRVNLKRRIGTHGPGPGEALRVWVAVSVAATAAYGVENLAAGLPTRGMALVTLGTFGVGYLLLTRAFDVAARPRRLG